jgi:hyperosmotically inducible protein
MKIRTVILVGSMFAAAGIVGCNRSTDTPATPKSSPGAPVTTAPESAPVARPSNPMAGQAIDDASITAKVKAALLAEADMKSMGISVETAQGLVTLTGRVPDTAQLERATQVARNVEGVKTVLNNLTVGAS